MRIRITKRPDGASALVCRRADGAECWQKHEKRQAAHFPLHDLTHYAVETVLGTDDACFGLVAAGWAFDDTTGNRQRGPVPDEANFVEHLVGLLDVERASGAIWTAPYLREQLARRCSPDGTASRRAVHWSWTFHVFCHSGSHLELP
jgi:hypothetical protein